MKVEASFTYDASSITSDYDVDSFANFCPTTGGTHEKGFIDGIFSPMVSSLPSSVLAFIKSITISSSKPIFTGNKLGKKYL